MIVLFSSRNEASANIARGLIGRHGFEPKGDKEWERAGVRMIGTDVESILDAPIGFEAEALIVLSTHRSAREGRMLTAHVPGNWGKAKMGGQERTLNIANGPLLKAIARAMDAEARRIGWPFSLEADHHGPTPGKPIIFMEIGNGEEQWADPDAAEAVARALVSVLDREAQDAGPGTRNTRHGTHLRSALCIGGGHYSREFTKVELEEDILIGHIAPKHALEGFDMEMLSQGLERCIPKSDLVLISKDGVSARQRDMVIALCQEKGVELRLI